LRRETEKGADDAGDDVRRKAAAKEKLAEAGRGLGCPARQKRRKPAGRKLPGARDLAYLVKALSRHPFGECPGDSVRIVSWGPLRIASVGPEGSADFVSYRLDLSYGGITSPTTDIATLSGLRVGQTVADLKRIYSGFAIEFVVDDAIGGLVFELRENQAGDILLWGPVDSQADDALVTGIYSKDHCETADPDPDG